MALDFMVMHLSYSSSLLSKYLMIPEFLSDIILFVAIKASLIDVFPT